MNRFFKLLLAVSCLSAFFQSCQQDEESAAQSSTREVGLIKDISGNTYSTVKIGNQTWFSENLKTVQFSNGDSISSAEQNSSWQRRVPLQCSYENSDLNAEKFGRLYNWYAVHDSRNLCPNGWRVPRCSDWNELEEFLGASKQEVAILDYGTDASKFKKIGAWEHKGNIKAPSNESGFGAIPSGARAQNGEFYSLGYLAYWWSNSISFCSIDKPSIRNHRRDDAAHFRMMLSSKNWMSRDRCDKGFGFAVRCIKN